MRLPGHARLRRAVAQVVSSVAVVLITATSVAALDLALGARTAWEEEARRNEREIGLDVVLCLRGTCGSDASVEDLERVADLLGSIPGSEVRQVDAMELRESLTGLLDSDDFARVRLPLTLQVLGDVPDLEHRAQQLLSGEQAVARIQPRNLAARDLAAQGREAYRTVTVVAAVQAFAAAVALAALTRSRVLSATDDIRLLNLSGTHPRRIRLPHVAGAALTGGVGGFLGHALAGEIGRNGVALQLSPLLADTADRLPAGVWAAGAALLCAVVARAAAAHDVRDIPL